MKGETKLICDLGELDTALLRRMAQFFEAKYSTIVRWALRFYALNGPIPPNWTGDRAALLDGFEGDFVVGLGQKETLTCNKRTDSPNGTGRRGRPRKPPEKPA